ncbi:UNVERIFIED_CONTAM: Serine/threonine-protein kinase fray2 [Sesamum angustifolium]|uniref:Serine/threonine-protein kinase fray2 n=1 Tax=Sesamum angustifolium TaxID=2727405 RepID=A0AAW2LKP1_9LAMI
MEKERKKYPIGAEHYTMYEEVGTGVSASVHRALCNPLNEIVAIKILDFERNNSDLNNISREAQTMGLVDHPNVLKSHCSFVSDHNLWVVMPYMAGGSCLHILKAAYPDGLEEVVIATVLREVLKGLDYLHQHGHIHRDVKAGNILIDTRGAIKLGDFGVSAYLFDSGDRQRMRNTFVGTPCWMAPEVMEQMYGYDFKSNDYIALLLPALGDRLQALKRKEEDLLAQKKMPDGQKEEISQIQDDDSIPEKEEDMQTKQLQHQPSFSGNSKVLQHQLSFTSQWSDAADSDDNAPASVSSMDSMIHIAKCEKSDDDVSIPGSTVEQPTTNVFLGNGSQAESNLTEKPVSEVNRKSSDGALTISNGKYARQSPKSVIESIASRAYQPTSVRLCNARNINGDEVDEKVKNPVVQQKGRFKVTSENVETEKVAPSPILQKSHSVQVIPQLSGVSSPLPSPLPSALPSDVTTSNLFGQLLFPSLQSVLQTNILQRDTILRLMKQIVIGDFSDIGSTPINMPMTEKSYANV